MRSVLVRTSFRRLTLRGVGAALVLALLTLPVCFALSDSKVAVTPDPSKRPPSLMRMKPELLSPRLREIRERLELEQSQLEPLRKASRESSDPEETQEIAGRMSELKSQTEGDILEIQLKYARMAGNPERVALLEKMIAQRNAPAVQKSTEAPVRRHRQEGPR